MVWRWKWAWAAAGPQEPAGTSSDSEEQIKRPEILAPRSTHNLESNFLAWLAENSTVILIWNVRLNSDAYLWDVESVFGTPGRYLGSYLVESTK